MTRRANSGSWPTSFPAPAQSPGLATRPEAHPAALPRAHRFRVAPTSPNPGREGRSPGLAPIAPAPTKPAHTGPQPRNGIERRLARIWESVLEVSPVGRRDDFFDLGGTSVESAIVLGLIEEIFSVALPPSTLVEHSTVEKLAARVAEDALIPSPTPLVRLRTRPAGRPLFLVHSGQGDVTSYGLLVRRLRDHPVYGLQSIGLHGECWPLRSIPDMARRYLPEVIATDPSGPYLLGGTCMGGLVAFEMAQQLAQQGRPVGLVAPASTPRRPPYSGRRSRWRERVFDPVRDACGFCRWSMVRAAGAGRTAPGCRAIGGFWPAMNGRARLAYRPGIYPEDHAPRDDRTRA